MVCPGPDVCYGVRLHMTCVRVVLCVHVCVCTCVCTCMHMTLCVYMHHCLCYVVPVCLHRYTGYTLIIHTSIMCCVLLYIFITWDGLSHLQVDGYIGLVIHTRVAFFLPVCLLKDP